ncbi:hypothetical protein SBD_2914 [Streptomyces bottropensis ATCC 25435]|uniref:Uncharacterized protein n=1 Tax=Streptomyces bottropensis ATCC 25435 TaxID=1054862 RepID=M3EH38_9ACTN|nr:hypothetical protein SBD_2914 [Streptomyces bottropensis ATCC 25435]
MHRRRYAGVRDCGSHGVEPRPIFDTGPSRIEYLLPCSYMPHAETVTRACPSPPSREVPPWKRSGDAVRVPRDDMKELER